LDFCAIEVGIYCSDSVKWAGCAINNRRLSFVHHIAMSSMAIMAILAQWAKATAIIAQSARHGIGCF
jgi:hypothetical protein